MNPPLGAARTTTIQGKGDSDSDSNFRGSEIAMVTVQMRVPEFWPDLPKPWFAQFEAIMAPQKQSDATKFDMVVAKLGREALRQVTDLIETPPATGKYDAIKSRLMSVFEESAESQFQRLVKDVDLGEQKPSQLLRRMQVLANNCGVTEDPLGKLWMNRLPSSVRAVLAVSVDMKLEDLAKIADKIVENLGREEIASLAPSTSSSAGNPEGELGKQLCELSRELREMRMELNEIRERGRDRTPPKGVNRWQQGRFTRRPRSRSTHRRTPQSADWLCRHHFRFRENAIACELPCNWNRRQREAEN